MPNYSKTYVLTDGRNSFTSGHISRVPFPLASSRLCSKLLCAHIGHVTFRHRSFLLYRAYQRKTSENCFIYPLASFLGMDGATLVIVACFMI